MSNLHTVEAPSHQHFHNQENDDSRDVILYGHYNCKHFERYFCGVIIQISCRCWAYKKAQNLCPVNKYDRQGREFNIRSDYCIDNSDSPIEGKLGDLCSRELSIRVSKLHRRSIFHIRWREGSSSNAIVSCLFDSIIYRGTGVL
jgi:hypothetical protein